MIPTYNPEIYGIDVEYLWGYDKIRYFRLFNNAITKNIDDNLKK